MRCAYNDGLTVDYDGSLRITKGSDVNVFMKNGRIPDEIKGDLESAVHSMSCSDLLTVSRKVRDSVGDRACVH